jgi:hypothetical protein
MKTPTTSRTNKENYQNFYSPYSSETKTEIKKSNLLEGLNFSIYGYQKKLKTMMETNIKCFGGEIVETPEESDYFLTPFLHDVQGEEFNTELDCIFCTIQYVDSCILKNELLDINSDIIFKPFKSIEGIEELKKWSIAVTNFVAQDRDDIIYLIKRTGAEYRGELNTKVNILISSKF